MSRAGWRATVGLVLALTGLPAVVEGLEVPYLAARVNDLADILSANAEERIESRLERLEASAGSQVAVLTVASLEGEDLEDFSLRVAETWQLGRADSDDGALLLIARDDRKMRLEVGYGLEPILTDAYSRRILDEVLQPHFRAGDFDGGVERAIEVTAALIEGNDILPAPTSRPSGGLTDTVPTPGVFFMALLIIPFAFTAIVTPGCSGWLVYVVMMPFVFGMSDAAFGSQAGLIGLAIWCLIVPLLRLVVPKSALGRRLRSRGSGGGWTSTGGWGGGGGSSGGGFSGGGFSGGGGSFGGGGSSSGW